MDIGALIAENKKAVDEEDYLKAAEIKKQLSVIDLETLYAEKLQAVAEEDYLRAAELKKAMDALKLYQAGGNGGANKNSSTSMEPVTPRASPVRVVMNDFDNQWYHQYEKLVDFKQKNDHCIVPKVFEQDKSLGNWVRRQLTFNTKNKMRQDRKELLDEIGFVWKADATQFKPDDKLWSQQYEKLVEFKRKKGHCMVPDRYEQDKAFGNWVGNQRRFHTTNKLRQDRKELLDEIGFVWRVRHRQEIAGAV
jgi:hypothetical protein